MGRLYKEIQEQVKQQPKKTSQEEQVATVQQTTTPPIVKVGRTVTGDPGTPANVSMTGADTLNFIIPEGIPGMDGTPGVPGAGINPLGTLVSTAELPDYADPGDAYFIQGHLWVWSDLNGEWLDAGLVQGPAGEPGPKGDTGETGPGGAAATITVGSVTTGAAGSSATIINAGNSSAATFNFTIPRGATGATGNTGPAGPTGNTGAAGTNGAAATIAVGTVTTGAAGSSASIINGGNSSSAVFNFTIPRGATGTTGSTGPSGNAATLALGAVTTGAPGTNVAITNSGNTTAAVFNFTIPQGVQGERGAAGPEGPAALIAIGTTTTGAAGSSANVVNSGNSSAAVLSFTIPRGNTGATGSTGAAATIAVGTVTTGAPGSTAAVVNGGNSSAAVFNFTIPRGDVGATGAAATVAVGSVTTGAAGSSASIVNAGNSSVATFNFTIPRGNTGATGATGNAATFALGTVSTGAPGSTVSITNSGNTTAAVLNFTIPRGDVGPGAAWGTMSGNIMSQSDLVTFFSNTGGQNMARNSGFDYSFRGTPTIADDFSITLQGTGGTDVVLVTALVDSPLGGGGKAQRVEINGTTTANTRYTDIRPLVAVRPKVIVGRTYTISSMVRGSPNSKGQMYIQWMNSAGSVLSTANSGPLSVASATDYTQYSVTGTAPAGTVDVNLFFWRLRGGEDSANVWVEVDNVKFEEGSIATNWSASPSDSFSMYEALGRGLTGVNNIVANTTNLNTLCDSGFQAFATTGSSVGMPVASVATSGVNLPGVSASIGAQFVVLNTAARAFWRGFTTGGFASAWREGMDLSTAQTVGGVKSFSNNIILTGTAGNDVRSNFSGTMGAAASLMGVYSGNASVIAVAMNYRADGTWSATSTPTYIQFRATASGSNAMVDVLNLRPTTSIFNYSVGVEGDFYARQVTYLGGGSTNTGDKFRVINSGTNLRLDAVNAGASAVVPMTFYASAFAFTGGDVTAGVLTAARVAVTDSAPLQFKFPTATGTMYLWGMNGAGDDVGTLTRESTSFYRFTINGSIIGSSSVGVKDRTLGTDWQVYAQDNAFRIWAGGIGDRFSVTSAGNASVVGRMDVGNQIYLAAGWFRSQQSGTGWYHETHGGGWYMVDNTWIRNYNSKRLLIESAGGADGDIRISSTSPTIAFVDTDRGYTHWIHCNDGNHGFLQENTFAWGAYRDAGANWNVVGNIAAYASDKRLKKNIKDVPYDVVEHFFETVQIRQFDWDEDKLSKYKIGFKGVKGEIGAIAQEFRQAFAPAVQVNPAHNPVPTEENPNPEKYDILTIDWVKSAPLVIEEVKRLRKRVAQLENKS